MAIGVLFIGAARSWFPIEHGPRPMGGSSIGLVASNERFEDGVDLLIQSDQVAAVLRHCLTREETDVGELHLAMAIGV